jgi:hypothetical protein
MSFMNKLQEGISKAGNQAAAFGSGIQKQVGGNQGVQGLTANFSLEKECVMIIILLYLQSTLHAC